MDQYRHGVVSLLREPSTKDFGNIMDPDVGGRVRGWVRSGKVRTGTESEWGIVSSRFPPLPSPTPAIGRSQQKGPNKTSAQGLRSKSANKYKSMHGQGGVSLTASSFRDCNALTGHARSLCGEGSFLPGKAIVIACGHA